MASSSAGCGRRTGRRCSVMLTSGAQGSGVRRGEAQRSAAGPRRPRAPPRASSHPDFHRRSWSSTRSTARSLRTVGSRTVTAGSELHRPRSTCMCSYCAQRSCHTWHSRRSPASGRQRACAAARRAAISAPTSARRRRPRSPRRRRSRPPRRSAPIVSRRPRRRPGSTRRTPDASSAARARRIFGSVPSMKDWPPNPGSTVITRSMSNSGSRSRRARPARPAGARSPRARRARRSSRASRTGAWAASAWNVTEAAPSLGVLGRPAVGVLDHEVHVERDGRDLGEPLTTGRPERQVRHEVVVHDVDVREVGRGDRPRSRSRLAKSADRMLGLISAGTRPA